MILRASISILLLFIFSYENLNAQQHEHIYLISRMDGEFELESGLEVEYWGFGYQSTNRITLPGPLLEVEQYDTVSIHFKNLSPESHTIHLHGLDVDQLNDGVPLTSAMVIPNDSITYTFVADHTGSFLYHCHVMTSLHLAMGMYGMVVVNPSQNGILFDGGPSFDQEYKYLLSELNTAWNINPTSPGPFHLYQADVFLVNGIYESKIDAEDDQHIVGYDNQNILIRMGSVCFSQVKITIPEELNSVFYMSDGRALPNAIDTNVMNFYPGERFEFILSPDQPYEGEILIEYIETRDEVTTGTNHIPVFIGGSNTIENKKEVLQLIDHPFQNKIEFISPHDYKNVHLTSIDGKKIRTIQVNKGFNSVQESLSSGTYFLVHDTFTQKIIVL